MRSRGTGACRTKVRCLARLHVEHEILQPICGQALARNQYQGLQDFMLHVQARTRAELWFGNEAPVCSTHLGLRDPECRDETLCARALLCLALAMPNLLGGRHATTCATSSRTHCLRNSKRAMSRPSPRSGVHGSTDTHRCANCRIDGSFGFLDVAHHGPTLPAERNSRRQSVQKLHATAIATLDDQSFREQLQSLGVAVVAPERRSPEYLARFFEDEIDKWATPIKAGPYHCAMMWPALKRHPIRPFRPPARVAIGLIATWQGIA